MKFEIPKPLKAEHDELRGELVQATKAGGRTGEAAKTVAKLLHPHFVKEEEYALPPLALLVALSQGKVEAGMADVLKMTDRLKPELSTMLAEHKEIVGALAKLVDAAKAENKPHIVHSRSMPKRRSRLPYPAAILVGEVVRAKLAN
jgi:hypothetical protein